MYVYYTRDGLLATELYPQDRADRDAATHNLAQEKVCPRAAGLKWAYLNDVGVPCLAGAAGLDRCAASLDGGSFQGPPATEARGVSWVVQLNR